MQNYENQPIILLKEGTNRKRNREAQSVNISSAKAVANAVKTTLGPKGMDKMLVDTLGEVTITNDGATILKEIDVQNPSAKMVVEVAKTQDEECGDGTTTAVVLAGELLKQAEILIDLNIHPTVIINGYKMALKKAIEVLNEVSFKVEDDEVLEKVSNTAMTGKSVGGNEKYLSKIVVKSVKTVAENGLVDMDFIKLEKKNGGSIGDTYLIKGVVLDKQVAHPRMPKIVKNAKIALISEPLEIKKTEFDAHISIKDPTIISAFLDEEADNLKKMADKFVSVGANVVFCQKGVDDLIQHYFAKENILCARRLKQNDIEALSKATGGKIIGNIEDMSEEDLGWAEEVEEKEEGEDEMIFVTGCANPKSVSIIIRGGTEHIVDEIERSLNDALRVVALTIEQGKVVAGGGAPEVEVQLKVNEFASKISGREQLAIESFSKSVEVIPWTISENAGLDSIEVISKLKSVHKNEENGKYFGIDVESGEPMDMLKNGVLEPLKMKIQGITSAVEVACMILRIDDVIASKKAAAPEGGNGPMKGYNGQSGYEGM